MSATAAVPEVGRVYETGPHGVRLEVAELGTGDRAGQVLIVFRSGTRFAGESWWWPADALDGWQRLPRGWDSTG